MTSVAIFKGKGVLPTLPLDTDELKLRSMAAIGTIDGNMFKTEGHVVA
jgi:hypothetical protein